MPFGRFFGNTAQQQQQAQPTQQPQATQQPSQPAQQPQQPTTLQQQQQPAMDPVTGAPTQQPAQQQPTTGQGDANTPTSGLDQFKDLWQTQDNPTDADKQTQPRLTLDDTAFENVLPKLDFTQNLPQEHIAKLSEGDLTVLPEVLNHVGRNAYKAAMQHATALVDRHLETKLGEIPNKLKDTVQTELTRTTVSQSVPDHPLVRAEMERVALQLRKKYPDASPQWIVEQSQRYISELAKVFGGDKGAQEPQTQPQQAEPEIDFAEFAGMMANEN